MKRLIWSIGALAVLGVCTYSVVSCANRPKRDKTQIVKPTEGTCPQQESYSKQ